MAINRLLKSIKVIIIPIILSSAIFFNLAHLLINYWEQPARAMILTFVLCVPLFSWLLVILQKRINIQISFITRKRLVSLILTSLILGTALTLAFQHVFTTTVIVSPILSNNQQVELLEVKANGHILPIIDNAAGYGWKTENNAIIASQSSQPMKIKLQASVNAPVQLLFKTSPESGNVIISYGTNKKELALNSLDSGEALYSFPIRYRNFPNWLFQPFLLMTDIIAFAFYALIIFILQEKGQKVLLDGDKKEVFFSHGVSLAILLTISAVLHLISALSIPLILDVDSPSFLRGAVHLVTNGNFDGVSMYRGPGTTLLFAPIAALFGRNPWGMKALLHLMAIGCVALNYRLAWQLSRKRWIAFLSGFATLLLPDLYFFSNYVMSDLPNIFLISLFSTVLISAMQTYKSRWVFSAFLIGSFAILLRSENMVLMAIGIAALSAPLIWNWLAKLIKGDNDKNAVRTGKRKLGVICLATLIALLPVLWWSAHNYRNFGFFGMSNYAGEVFYTGWVYYGEASGYHFLDPDSQAVQKIKGAIENYPIKNMDPSGVPTGWNLYPSLMASGYTSVQAFSLMADAARDSIKNNTQMAWDILRIKLMDGLTPRTTNMYTFPLPGEPNKQREIAQQFFDFESLRIPWLIKTQRAIYNITQIWFDSFYQFWIWMGLFAAYFCLQRKPTLMWSALVLIMVTRIFIPDIMGKADWRYTISGLVLMTMLTIAWLTSLGYGIRSVISDWKKTYEKTKNSEAKFGNWLFARHPGTS
jgi:4-amino-4-deoxy-L-arabinose transferase-like glycosyltransferase